MPVPTRSPTPAFIIYVIIQVFFLYQIAAISPDAENYEQTLSTLRYGKYTYSIIQEYYSIQYSVWKVRIDPWFNCSTQSDYMLQLYYLV